MLLNALIIVGAASVLGGAVAFFIWRVRKPADAVPAELVVPAGPQADNWRKRLSLRVKSVIIRLPDTPPPTLRAANGPPLEIKALKPQLIARLNSTLATMPQASKVTAQLLASLREGDASVAKMAKLVAQDEAFSAEMLRMANSPVAAQKGKVTSIDQAVMLFGTDTVLAVTMRGTYASLATQSRVGVFKQDAILRHSVVTGLFAGALARRLGLNPSEALAAGLFHDAGKIVMNVMDPDATVKVLDKNSSRPAESRGMKEDRIFGFSHPVVGALLAKRWNLSPTAVTAIELHHHVAAGKMNECPHPQLLAVLFVANQLAKYAKCPGDDPEIDALPPEVAELLGLEGKYTNILNDLMADVRVPLAAFLSRGVSK